MKKGIHPETYRPVVFKDVGTDDTFLIHSTVETKETIKWEDGNEYPLYKLEISHRSHPFFTGKMKFVDTAGRIEKFEKRYAKFNKKKIVNKSDSAEITDKSDSTDDADKNKSAKEASRPVDETKAEDNIVEENTGDGPAENTPTEDVPAEDAPTEDVPDENSGDAATDDKTDDGDADNKEDDSAEENPS